MKLYLLPSDNLLPFITHLSTTGSVFYPEKQGTKTHFVRFNKGRSFEPVFSSIRTAENLKHFLFPSRDVVAAFPKDMRPSTEKQFIIGVKNCDLRGVDVYDRVFLKSDPVDPGYKQKRENTVVLSADCPEPEDCCFCSLVGLKPYGEAIADINMTPVTRGYVFEAFTKTGEHCIGEQDRLFTECTKEDQKERDKVRTAALKKLTAINPKPFSENLAEGVAHGDPALYHEARKDCVECHACLHACPTCYCFLLSDYRKGKEYERVRTWDVCYYAAYARVGGGANPRSEFDQRFWNRFQCKFNYFKQYEGFFACSGCGRCYRGCSGKIDIREILWKL
jgi:sulfhydrogenase subunit beta (sulfur reductase)